MSSSLFIKMRLKPVLLFLVFVFIQNTTLIGSDHFRYGTPFIQHFTKKDYKAGNKNWSITQDENGLIYVGNSNSLLQYDGFRWARYALPSGTILRAVHEHNGRIYCGSLGEFGYWENDENFEMKYTSLTHLLGDYDFGDEEIWWITEIDGHIIFQTFATTFLYDGQEIEIIVQDKGVIFPPFAVHNRLLLQVLDSGLFEMQEKEIAFVPGSEVFNGMRVITMLPVAQSSGVLIGTEENGFFLYENGEFRPWRTTHDKEILRDQVNRGVKIADDLYAIGTLIGGVYIINSQGEVLNHINKEKGLNNNTVLSFYLDMNGNLWVGLDNGIDLIKVNSPVYYHTDFSGEIGSVYTAAIHNEELYLGTNRGVFHTRFNQQSNTQNSSFSIIPGSQGQVWNLAVIDGQLFCGQNNSTYSIENYKLKKVSNIAGGYQIEKYPYGDQYLVQGSYNGLAIYEKQDNNWVYSHILPGFSRLSKSIEFERENVLWVSHTHKGLYRLELNDDLTEIIEIRSFSENSKTYLNKLNKRLVFSSDSGFVYYDDIQNTFFSLDDLNQALGDFALNAHIISTGEDNYWIFRDGDCARVVMDEDNVREIDHDVLNDLDEFLIPGYEDIYTVDSTYTIVFLDNGYAVFNKHWSDTRPDHHPDVFIRWLQFHNLLGKNMPAGDLLNIPFRFNNLRISLSYPEFAANKNLLYRLDGYNDRWISAGNEGEITFQNLPSGDYAIRVKPYGGTVSDETTINFSINPPWLQSKTARLLYLIAAVLTIILFVVLNKRKIKRIHDKHELERKRLMEKEAAESQRKIMAMRNENLRKEIKLRNSKLAKSTFSLIHKNNTLRSVKTELIKIKEDLGVRFPAKHFNRLIRNIDRDLTSEKDWRMFEQSFSEVHENFLTKLKEEYPELTPADIQLCAYLKLNLPSKEIASLLNITVRAVEIRRYRLRKKLDLEHDMNLTEFIMGY